MPICFSGHKSLMLKELWHPPTSVSKKVAASLTGNTSQGGSEVTVRTP